MGNTEIDFKVLTENSNDVVLQIGHDGICQYVSPSSLRLFGRAPDELIGRDMTCCVLPEDAALIDQVHARHKSGEITNGIVQFRAVRKDGTTVWVEGSAQSIPSATRLASKVIVILRDISDRKALEERLLAMALIDGLTGLANRRAFDDDLRSEWRRALRSGSPLSLLLLDVDHFKSFNDTYGHLAGDDCLRSVAATVRSALYRPADKAARYGGEELAIILPETDQGGAIEVAEALRIAIEGLHVSQDAFAPTPVTVSVGAATALLRAGGTVQLPTGLLQTADTALYHAKSRGRNRVESAIL